MSEIQNSSAKILFGSSLLQSATNAPPQARWPAVASVAIQCAVAAALLAIPLLHPAALSLIPRNISLAPPPLPRPPQPLIQPRPQIVHLTNAAAAPSSPTPVIERISSAHPFTNPSPLSDAPPVDAPALAFGSPTGSPDALASILHGAPIGSSPHVVPSAGGAGGSATHPVNISQGVSAGLLLSPIRPVYPPLARAARQSGEVRVAATISPTGRVENVHALSGPAMLQQAACAAVREARYKPYLLNGQPTTVEATFTINFHLND